VLGVIGNITERKRADAVLAESEQRFRAIFESGMYFQALLDLDCQVLEANPAMLKFGGLNREDVRGKPLWEGAWWQPERRAQLQRACEEAREGRTALLHDDIRGAGHRVTAIEYSVRPIRNHEGAVVQLLFEGRDVTERKRAEAVLREMNTLTTMGRLAAHVAHEINNPLAGIQNSFLLIRDAIPDTHPHYAYVGAIEREMARIARVTRQLYETYRQGQEEDTDASIAVEAGDAVGLLSQLNRSKQVTITLDTAGAPPVVPIPGAIVRQTLFNLVQNAVDASPAGGSVAVRAWAEGPMLRLSVSDEGPGVPEELRERVFEPFFSTKSNLRTGGMGIGLSIVRRSIEALGGRVWITADGAAGATFQVEIPLPTHEPVRGDDDSPRSHPAG
jgi:PAS domain S-box-containing protein